MEGSLSHVEGTGCYFPLPRQLLFPEGLLYSRHSDRVSLNPHHSSVRS